MRRGFWLATGFGLGVAVSRRARRRNDGGPARRSVVGAALRAHVQRALNEGRWEAQRRERALRDVLASPGHLSQDGDK